MAAPASQYKDRQFLAVIGDEVISYQGACVDRESPLTAPGHSDRNATCRRRCMIMTPSYAAYLEVED